MWTAPARFAAEVWRRNPLLAALGWTHALLFVSTLILLCVDEREVLGTNAWVKPAKFMASLALYLWTVAWFSEYVRTPAWRVRAVSVVIAIAIAFETACILMQAGRGTMSHFNTSTDFDAFVFYLMGVMIGIDMLMMVIVLGMFRRPSVEMAPSYLWGIRLGIVVFLVGGWIGGRMIGIGAHTVGAADGGPGLPFLNWSTVAGGLRIAHGLGLHALQALPLLGYLIGRWDRLGHTGAKVALTGAAAAIYAVVVIALFRQALAGQPLIAG